MRFTTRGASRIAIAAVALVALAACSDETTAPINEGRVRAVHAISNVGGVDILFNATTYKANVAYKGTDGYRAIITGATPVKFRKTGVAADLHAANVNIANAVDYTFFALGTEAAPQSFMLTDDNSAPAAGKVKLRAVHAAAASGALDVYVLANANELANAVANKANLAAKAASDYIVKDAGTYVVIFTTAGTKTAVLTVNDVQVAAGKIRSIVAVEKAGGGAPLEGIILADN